MMLKKIKTIIKEQETSHLDFKRQWHSGKIELLHDILCLSNILRKDSRFLIIGVDDSKALFDVSTDPKRRSSHDVYDFLRKCSLNRIPSLKVYSKKIDGSWIDIIEIEDQPEKPYFLLKDYKEKEKNLRAGVVYSRLGDTNTPIDGTASSEEILKMYRQQMGLDLAPLSRVLFFMKNSSGWEYMDSMNPEYYYAEFPEFRLKKSALESEPFLHAEPWAKYGFAAKDSKKCQWNIIYLGTTLCETTCIFLDGGRFTVGIPNRYCTDERMYFYYTKNSIEYLITSFFDEHRTSRFGSSRGRLIPRTVSIFENDREAKLFLEADKIKRENQYPYFKMESDEFVKAED